MRAGRVLSHPRLPNSSPGYTWREILHGCVGCVNVSRDHSEKLEKVFYTRLKIPDKVGLNFKGILRSLFSFFFSQREIPEAGSGVQAPQEEKKGVRDAGRHLQ